MAMSSAAPLAVEPSFGQFSLHTPVVVSGAGYADALQPKCRFGHLLEPATAIDAERVRCVAPPQPPGEVEVRLTADGVHDGEASAAFVYRDAHAPPTLLPPVLSLAGPSSGGEVVELRASNLAPTGALVCAFGGAHTDASYAELTLARCISPPLADAASVPLRISADGVHWSDPPAMYTYYDARRAPSVSRAQPAYAPTAPGDGGATITLHGANFAPVGARARLGCAFGESSGNSAAPFAVTPASFGHSGAVRCTLPSSPPLGSCTVTLALSGDPLPPWRAHGASWAARDDSWTAAGSNVSFAFYDDRAPPRVSSISPAIADRADPGPILLAGSNFAPGMACAFGEASADSASIFAEYRDGSTAVCTPPRQLPLGASDLRARHGGALAWSAPLPLVRAAHALPPPARASPASVHVAGDLRPVHLTPRHVDLPRVR